MIDFKRSIIQQISIHKIGPVPDQVYLSQFPVNLDNKDLSKRLTGMLLKGMNPEVEYCFPGGSETAQMVSKIFNQPELFHEFTKEITLQYIQSLTNGSNQEGEFIIFNLDQIQYNDEVVDGVGIIKTEGKDDFLFLEQNDQSYEISISKGISLKKLDKQVIILNSHENDGFRCLLKKINYNAERNHFIDEFLQINPLPNSYYNTSNYFNLLKTFVNDEMEAENKLEKVDKLNRSMDYLKNHETFKSSDFENEVFNDREEKEAFLNFRRNYATDNELEITDEFEISPRAVQHNTRYIRSVIKLDKNFHVYVHGNRQNIIRGYDEEKNMYFYQLFFSEES